MGELLNNWLGVVAVSVGLVGIIYTWLTARSNKLGDALAAVAGGQVTHEQRIQKLESEIQHMPDVESLHKHDLALVEMTGDIKIIATDMEAMKRSTHRMEQFLMESSKQ